MKPRRLSQPDAPAEDSIAKDIRFVLDKLLEHREDRASTTLDQKTLQAVYHSLLHQVHDTFADTSRHHELPDHELQAFIYTATIIAFEAYLHGFDRELPDDDAR